MLYIYLVPFVGQELGKLAYSRVFEGLFVQPNAWHNDVPTGSYSVGIAYAQLCLQNKMNG